MPASCRTKLPAARKAHSIATLVISAIINSVYVFPRRRPPAPRWRTPHHRQGPPTDRQRLTQHHEPHARRLVENPLRKIGLRPRSFSPPARNRRPHRRSPVDASPRISQAPRSSRTTRQRPPHRIRPTTPRGPLSRPHPSRRRTRLPPPRSRPHHRRPESAPARTHGVTPQRAGHARFAIAPDYRTPVCPRA
jgi:hypothetical protein